MAAQRGAARCSVAGQSRNIYVRREATIHAASIMRYNFLRKCRVIINTRRTSDRNAARHHWISIYFVVVWFCFAVVAVAAAVVAAVVYCKRLHLSEQLAACNAAAVITCFSVRAFGACC